MSLAIGIAAVMAWAVLLFGRGGFWLARDDDRGAPVLPEPAAWPAVAAVVPARDEATTIGQTVRSLLAQDYPGAFRLVVVNDRSTDSTGALAVAAAGGDPRFALVTGLARPAGWTGKLWALQQGLDALGETPGFLLFTDADITHAPDSLRRLVQRALAEGRVLVSLMARLRCESPAERWLIPAFIFFFQMLYPFRWSNAPDARTAAAAGGCVLLNRAAFQQAGGLAPISDAIIDDCALARRMKAVGPTWTGLSARPSTHRKGWGVRGEASSPRVQSLRPYAGFAEIRHMVTRTAYAQLGYRPVALAGMVVAMVLVFLAPPLLGLFGHGAAQALGLVSWVAMAVAFTPTLRSFGLTALRGLALPGIAATYLLFTLESALADRRGHGGVWKGEPGPRADGPAFNRR